MSPYLLALTAALLFIAQPVGATIADDICFFTDDPCVLPQGKTFVVDDNSVLDFGSRAFVLPGGTGTKLDIQSGTVRIIARTVRVNPGSAIVGNVNFFMQVPIEAGGVAAVADKVSPPGSFVELRAERDTLAVLSNCPQVHNPCNGYNPTPIRVIVRRTD